MKHKKYGNLISIFALLLVVFSNSLWSAKVDTVWVSDFKGGIRFQHPITKNLVLEGSNKLIELDSKNGNVLRELPYTNVGDNKPYISKDGTKLLHTNGNNTFIYEYPSMELITKLDSNLFSKFINNDEVIGRNFFTSDLIKYNLKTKERQIFKPEGSVQDIATSPDGRFIAYSTKPLNNNEDWTKLYLLDATTMEQIALLEEVKNTGHNFRYLSFSDDGKYLATNSTVYYSDFQRNIYSTETLKIVKNFNPENLKTDYLETRFLNEKIYSLISKDFGQGQSGDLYQTKIIDINTNKTLLTINDTYSLIFNNELNHIYYLDIKNKKIICLNISNIITGVTSPRPTTIVKYQNKELTINKENVRKVEISDIGGRLIINKIIENPISNTTIFPINLMNGQYLINITTDKESFTHKLLVME
jgi:hypothetical protein